MIEKEVNEQNLFGSQIANMDQFNAMSIEMAVVFSKFYATLINNDVAPDHALVMTVEYIHQIISQAGKK